MSKSPCPLRAERERVSFDFVTKCRNPTSKTDKTQPRSMSEVQAPTEVMDELIIEPSPHNNQVLDEPITFSPGFKDMQKKLAEKTVSMIVNLFTTGFAFDSQDTQYAWTSTIGEEMSFALDYATLTPALDKLLSTGRTVYYSGCVVIEVRDYRAYDQGTYDDPCSPYHTAKPHVFRMELRGNAVQILYQYLDGKLEDEEEMCLKVEEGVLRKLNPICIENSPSVFVDFNNIHYNQHKFNYYPSTGQRSLKSRLIAKRKWIEPPAAAIQEARRKRQRLGVVPFLQKVGQKSGVISLLENDFHKKQLEVVTELEKKIERPNHGSYIPPPPDQRHSIKITRKPYTDLNVPSTHSHLLQKRMIRFRVNKGQDFVLFEVIPKANGCYDGRLRVGSCPDTGTNGEFSERFSIGNTKGALSFIRNLRDLEYQEWNNTGDFMPHQPQNAAYPAAYRGGGRGIPAVATTAGGPNIIQKGAILQPIPLDLPKNILGQTTNGLRQPQPSQTSQAQPSLQQALQVQSSSLQSSPSQSLRPPQQAQSPLPSDNLSHQVGPSYGSSLLQAGALHPSMTQQFSQRQNPNQPQMQLQLQLQSQAQTQSQSQSQLQLYPQSQAQLQSQSQQSQQLQPHMQVLSQGHPMSQSLPQSHSQPLSQSQSHSLQLTQNQTPPQMPPPSSPPSMQQLPLTQQQLPPPLPPSPPPQQHQPPQMQQQLHQSQHQSQHQQHLQQLQLQHSQQLQLSQLQLPLQLQQGTLLPSQPLIPLQQAPMQLLPQSVQQMPLQLVQSSQQQSQQQMVQPQFQTQHMLHEIQSNPYTGQGSTGMQLQAQSPIAQPGLSPSEEALSPPEDEEDSEIGRRRGRGRGRGSTTRGRSRGRGRNAQAAPETDTMEISETQPSKTRTRTRGRPKKTSV